MAKKIKGDNNILITGDKNKVIQSPIFNNSKIINRIDKPANAITEEQAYEIKRLIDNIVKNTNLPYPAVWGKFKSYVKVSEYKAMPADKYDAAIKYLKKWQAATAKKLKSTDTDTFRKKRYTAIYARLKNLGITKEELANYLQQNYSVTSLKELTLNSLESIYTSVMNKNKLH